MFPEDFHSGFLMLFEAGLLWALVHPQCLSLYQQTLVFLMLFELKINRKYTTIKQWLRTKLSQFRNDPLNQRFFFNDVFIAYFHMVFVYAASIYAYKK